MKPLNCLCGFEESQEIMKAFRALGHNAFSCDLKPCSGGYPEFHLQMDIFKAIKSRVWDIAILCPPCTWLTVSANRWLKDQPERESGVLVGAARRQAQKDAVEFVKKLWAQDKYIKRMCIENPIGVLSSQWKKPTQIIQPWMYGHGETKATCLWLKRLPRLNGFDVVAGREQRIFKMSPSADRAAERSKTFPGIAAAMSSQWSYFK